MKLSEVTKVGTYDMYGNGNLMTCKMIFIGNDTRVFAQNDCFAVYGFSDHAWRDCDFVYSYTQLNVEITGWKR